MSEDPDYFRRLAGVQHRGDLNLLSAVEYAVEMLQVRHAIICNILPSIPRDQVLHRSYESAAARGHPDSEKTIWLSAGSRTALGHRSQLLFVARFWYRVDSVHGTSAPASILVRGARGADCALSRVSTSGSDSESWAMPG